MPGTPDADTWHVPERPAHPDMAVILDVILTVDAAITEGTGRP